MKLLLAQGNPGPEYASSRHNVGFTALDYICKQRDLAPFQHKAKFHAFMSEFSYQDEKLILAKPTTFYNQTGQSARAIVDFYGIKPSNILIIHDELALDLGTLRIRSSGSDAGNKGIRSLASHIGSEFWRIRVGIRTELATKMDGADFVLSRFSKDEMRLLDEEILPQVDSLVEDFIQNTLEVTSITTPQGE